MRKRTSTERRQYKRHGCQMPAVVSWNKDKVPAIVQNVSLRGMLLGAEMQIPLYQLMRVAFDETPDGGALDLNVMVVWVDSDDGGVIGVGAELYANSRTQVSRWEKIVDDARVNMEREPKKRRDTRRDFERFKAILEVRVKSADDLVTMYCSDVSKGGMYIETDMDLYPGTEIILDIVHPETGQVMHLDALVVRKHRRGEKEGVAVEFSDLDDAHREAMWKFVSSTVKF